MRLNLYTIYNITDAQKNTKFVFLHENITYNENLIVRLIILLITQQDEYTNNHGFQATFFTL